MVVGIAIAGGSSVAMLATQCSLDWLHENKIVTPESDVVYGTCSGGTIGTGVYYSAKDRLAFPEYDVAMTYEEVNGLDFVEKGETWFAHVTTSAGLWSSNFADIVWKLITGRFTWSTVLKSVIFNAYDIDTINPGPHKWVTNIMYVEKEKAPPIKNKYGYVPDAINSGMGQLWSEVNTPGVGEPHEIVKDFSTWDTMSYSSHIASYIIFSYNNKTQFDGKLKYVPSSEKYFFSDGGWIDETAITNVLLQKVSSVVSYISWPDLWHDDGRLSSLFGNHHNGNHTLGPKYSQIFEASPAILTEALRNLSDPSIARATFENVKVVQNDFFGIKPYTLKKLLILTDQRSQEFIDSFQDKRISNALNTDPRFPVGYENWAEYKVEWTPLTANAYCMYQQYKGNKYENELRALFDADKKHNEVHELRAPVQEEPCIRVGPCPPSKVVE